MLKSVQYRFWANKGAVGGTFAFVSIFGVALMIGVGSTILKRRKRRSRRHRQNMYFEKYPPTRGATSGALSSQAGVGQDGTGDGHLEEPEPIVTEAMAPAAPDAYPDRQIHYGGTQLPQEEQNMYYDGNGVGYLLGAEYAQQNGSHEQEQATYYHGGYDTQAAQSAQPSLPPTNSQYPSNHPFNQPRNTQSTGLAPVAFRQPPARGYGYEQSIDSFYGVQGNNNDAATHAV